MGPSGNWKIHLESSDVNLSWYDDTFNSTLVATNKFNINHITDVKEFKKGNSNFITLNLHHVVNIINQLSLLNRMSEVLNKELVNVINDDVAKLIIDFSYEGLVREDWFYSIHRMIKKTKLNTSNIYFISNDNKLGENYDTWINRHNVPKINIIELNRYLEEAKPWIRDIDKFPIEDFKGDRIREKKFTCLNGAFRTHRARIVSELFRSGLDKDGYISYIGNYGERLPIESDLLPELDTDTIKYFIDNLVPRLPIVVDLEKDVELIEPYIGSSYVHEMYTNSYFNIITETSYNFDKTIIGNNVYLTEKTYRPMFGMQPFILVSNPGCLNQLRNMGFETFPEFFDESYDEIENPWHRMDAILVQIKEICSLSYEEIHDRYYSIFWKLEANRNRLIEIADDREINYGNYTNVFE
jgi:hypothetical protein